MCYGQFGLMSNNKSWLEDEAPVSDISETEIWLCTVPWCLTALRIDYSTELHYVVQRMFMYVYRLASHVVPSW